METIEDIIKEMRGMPSDLIVDADANFVFRSYADRLDAAFDRFCNSKRNFYCTNTECEMKKALSELIEKGGI